MAAPPNRTFIEGQIIDHHRIDIETKQNRHNSVYTMIDTYNWNGLGPMPGLTWTAPTGSNFRYTPGNAEFEYAGSPYSTLTPVQKREFFKYLPAFVVQCLKNYDDSYNL